jgi:hypothetical protein
MKKLPIIIYILIALMSIGLALADEVLYDNTDTTGLRFDSNQTVEGFGIASSYRCMGPLDLVLHSHSSGSGVSSSESRSYVRNDEIVEGSPDSFSENKTVGHQEITSNAYSPTILDYPGSFRSGPIRSLWSDSTFLFAGKDDVTVLKASFDQVQVLNKEMTTKISSGESYQDLAGSSAGSFASSMKLNAVFNGTGQIGAYVGTLNGENPDVLVDEYYRGTFTISKKMEIGLIKSSLAQDEDDEWLPCCSGGWINMDYINKKSFPVDVNRVFNCTCF